ncbi:hypothetical protein LZ32DRAFT_600929 [Colletotrichum eremochloae]|nr:hypothetical protein LZ32DRAFT_600929 [Colletotrichum eremochloae]
MNRSRELCEDKKTTTSESPRNANPKLPTESDSNDIRPTHRLERLKVGEKGVQLLVSTHDHLYTATNVEAGNYAFQCVGGWTENSIPELGQMISSHQNESSRSPQAEAKSYPMQGRGRTLGES